jgi:hypothetical protein
MLWRIWTKHSHFATWHRSVKRACVAHDALFRSAKSFQRGQRLQLLSLPRGCWLSLSAFIAVVPTCLYVHGCPDIAFLDLAEATSGSFDQINPTPHRPLRGSTRWTMAKRYCGPRAARRHHVHASASQFRVSSNSWRPKPKETSAKTARAKNRRPDPRRIRGDWRGAMESSRDASAHTKRSRSWMANVVAQVPKCDEEYSTQKWQASRHGEDY